MSKYTENHLNSLNKTALVALALSLAIQVENYASAPLKSSDVEKQMLELARQAANVKSQDDIREQEHTLQLAQIEADKALAIKKLELEFAEKKGLTAEELLKTYKELEEKAKIQIEDLSFGLKKAEIESNQKVEEFTTKIQETENKYKELIEAKQAEFAAAKEKTDAEVAALKQSHERLMEQTKYENSIALRDENLKSANAIAAKYDSEVVNSNELKELKDAKKTDEAEVELSIENAVKSAKAEVYATEGKKFSELKSSTDSRIALLENDKNYLTQTIKSQEERIAELMEQVKNFPTQIKEAVAAAKADISVNQDAGKK